MSKKNRNRILYIDDEESNLRAFKNLYRRNFIVTTTCSAEEFLYLFKNDSFDLVVADQQMPQITGLRLLESIKKINSLVPTILLTGYTDHDVLKQAFNDVRVDKYINKPFDTESLLAIMELAIDKYHLNIDNNKIEEELHASESKFRGIFESIADVFIRVNNKGIIEIISPSIKELSGYDPVELIGENIIKLCVFEDREILVKEIEEGKIINGRETRLLTKDQKIKYISSTSKCYYDDNNNPIGIESVVRDVSERRKMMKLLIEQKDFLGEVQKMANLGSWQWSKVSDELNWSDTLYEIYKIKKENSSKNSLEEYLSYFHSSDKKRVRDIIFSSIEERKDFTFEAIIVRTDGKERIIRSLGKVVVNRENILTKITVACLDITESKRKEKTLKTLNDKLELKVIKRTQDLEIAKNDIEQAYRKEKELGQLKSQFVSTASHQFRTPLTVIQSNIGLLEMQIQQSDPVFRKKFDRVYERIQSEVKRMTDLMDNVLVLGKKESGVIKPNMQMVDVLALTRTIIEKHNEIQEDARKIEVSFKGFPSSYHIDPELFENAFSNLISNAFKYSKLRPSPLVHLQYKKAMLIITIQDFGVGIPKKDINNIFEPFYRAGNVKDIGGTGLGTSIIKAYLELIDATIDIESEVGIGTTFTVSIKK